MPRKSYHSTLNSVRLDAELLLALIAQVECCGRRRKGVGLKRGAPREHVRVQIALPINVHNNISIVAVARKVAQKEMHPTIEARARRFYHSPH